MGGHTRAANIRDWPTTAYIGTSFGSKYNCQLTFAAVTYFTSEYRTTHVEQREAVYWIGLATGWWMYAYLKDYGMHIAKIEGYMQQASVSLALLDCTMHWESLIDRNSVSSCSSSASVVSSYHP